MASNDEELIYEAICARLASFANAAPFDIAWAGAAYGPIYGRAFVEIGFSTIDQTQEAGSPVHSRVVRALVLKIATPKDGGRAGWIKFAEALREHFFPLEEVQDLQSGAGPFVRIESRPELLKSSERSDELTEVAFGFVRGRLGIRFFFEPTV